MAPLVTAGALVLCDMGKIPTPLVVIPEGIPVLSGAPAATIMNFAPFVNIETFGVCSSPLNPACDNPTGEGPCVPSIVAPWAPGCPTVLVNGVPALTADSLCECAFGGVVAIIEPGASNVMLPD